MKVARANASHVVFLPNAVQRDSRQDCVAGVVSRCPFSVLKTFAVMVRSLISPQSYFWRSVRWPGFGIMVGNASISHVVFVPSALQRDREQECAADVACRCAFVVPTFLKTFAATMPRSIECEVALMLNFVQLMRSTAGHLEPDAWLGVAADTSCSLIAIRICIQRMLFLHKP